MNINKLNNNKSIAFALAFSLAAPASVAHAAEGRGALDLLGRSVKVSNITVGNLTFGDIVRPVSGSDGWLSMTCPSGGASVALAGGVENPDTNDDECGVVTVTRGSADQALSFTFASSTPFTNGSSTLDTKFTIYRISETRIFTIGLFSNIVAGSASVSVRLGVPGALSSDWRIGTEVSGISSDDPLGVYTATYEMTITAD